MQYDVLVDSITVALDFDQKFTTLFHMGSYPWKASINVEAHRGLQRGRRAPCVFGCQVNPLTQEKVLVQIATRRQGA